jgi:hypothetical protein
VGTIEVYVITDGIDRFFFNVERAKKIVADGRPAIELAVETIQDMLTVNHYEVEHLQHVDVSRPGILLERFGGLVLLDGIHRAARCLRERRKFYVHVLSDRESLNCLVRQDIASNDVQVIVECLRKVLKESQQVEPLQVEIECSARVLSRVRQLLNGEENRRLILHEVGNVSESK